MLAPMLQKAVIIQKKIFFKNIVNKLKFSDALIEHVVIRSVFKDVRIYLQISRMFNTSLRFSFKSSVRIFVPKTFHLYCAFKNY